MTGIDFSKLLGSRPVVEDEDGNEKQKTVDPITSLVQNYGQYQLGKTDMVKELRAVKTDEELLAYVEKYFHINIPYEPVCEHHQSPGQAFCDVFFGRATEALWWASRASFKSFGTGLLTVLNTLRYNNAETVILAGSREQGGQVYAAAEHHVHAAKLENFMHMRRTFTTADNGSSFRVLTASAKSARGPHPQFLSLDEVDEIPREVFDAAVNQPMTKHGIQAQTLMTSTMHKVYGLMSELIDNSSTSGIKVYNWCYKEVTEKCEEPDCRSLIYSDRFQGEPCPLLGNHLSTLEMLEDDDRARIRPAREYVTLSGSEDDGRPINGYFDGSCQGCLRRANGFVPVDDQRAAYGRVGRKRWEVENECRRPSQEDMVYDPVILQRSTLPEITWDFTLDSERNWAMADWGYNNPTALLIAQDKVLPGKPLLHGPHHHCIIKEWYWEQRGLNWRIDQIVDILQRYDIHQFFADGENIDALHALREALQLAGWNCLVRGVPFNRFKETLIEQVRNDMEHYHLYISEEGCPNTIRDLYRLHYKPNTEKVAKEDDHGPDAILAGWRRFLPLGDYNMSGTDFGQVGRQRDIARPGSTLQLPAPGSNRGGAGLPSVPASSPVGIGSAGRSTRNSRRNRRG